MKQKNGLRIKTSQYLVEGQKIKTVNNLGTKNTFYFISFLPSKILEISYDNFVYSNFSLNQFQS